MGTNRRHAASVARDIDRQIEQLVVRPKPISLTDQEHTQVTVPPGPVEVYAWVRYPEAPIRARGRAIAWTSKAVLVEEDTAGGERAEAWVWASAVEHIPPR